MPAALRIGRLLLLVLCLLPLAVLADGVTGVGIHAIEVHDPVNDGAMPGYVFYPSTQAKGSTWIAPYEVAATVDAAELPGARPLVVLSHGNGGSDLDLHDIATYLASHGFVVATLEHPRDNYHDQSGVGRAPVLDGRPIQVQAVITYLLNDAKWSKLIDAKRIGVGGFSAGGYTSLLLVGAVPRFDRFIGYCERYPGDDLCAGAKQMRAEAVSHGQTIEQMFGETQKDFTRWGKAADRRVKAAFAMAPLSLIFDASGVASIDRPVFLYYGQDDHLARPLENARHIAPSIKTLTGIKEIPKADHWVFLAPCSPTMTKRLPVMCSDPAGVDRAKVHAQIQVDALAFFRKTLGAGSN
jgi:predicted dienelactone hydrolase